jgi:hypothetical protein
MWTEFKRGVGLALCTLLIAANSHADKGDASLRFEYQYIRTGAFDSSIGDFDIGNTDAHVFMLSGDYAINDRWTVMASLPWIQKRHTGALPHNPVLDFQNYSPPDLRVLDTGEYHAGWQDLYIGVQYLAKDGPFSIAPFIVYGVPVNDYPFYAHSAIGRNIWHIPVGVALSYTPYFSDFNFSGNIAYVFTEKSLGVDVSHWLINASVSYYVKPRFAPKMFVSVKHGTKGLGFPDDFDLFTFDFDSEEWYYHDRTIKHNWVNAGVGFDWVINADYHLSGTLFKMVNPQQVNIVDRAWTLGITRYFAGD